MPSKSKEQHDMMVAAANSKKFADKVGIQQSVAKEFVEKDKEAGLWQDEESEDEDSRE